MTREYVEVPGSFRDPSGYVYFRDGEIYRQVNRSYQEDYDRLVDSGLCQKLVGGGLLIPHVEVGLEYAAGERAYQVIKPQQIPFISYPYEWCFSELKDAALLTLEIQQRAFDSGMSLKDCSAYNVQFAGGKPVFIDTLSFERYREGQPWVAYRQFCQHFLAPLALMSYVDIRLHRLLRVYPAKLWPAFPYPPARQSPRALFRQLSLVDNPPSGPDIVPRTHRQPQIDGEQVILAGRRHRVARLL
jgi:hypothetical protein